MILVDTSVWVDHLRAPDPHLIDLLESDRVLGHPWVRGEIVLGGLREDSKVAQLMPYLPEATIATDLEMMVLIRNERMAGSGIGYVDAQLLTAARLTPDALLWTRDRQLDRIADHLGVAYRATSGCERGPGLPD